MFRATKVYVSCDDRDLQWAKEKVEQIANEKGCDPIQLRWPLVASSAQEPGQPSLDCEIQVCKKHFLKDIEECEIFIAIIGKNYGAVELAHPDGESNERISRTHFELLSAMNAQQQSSRGTPVIYLFESTQGHKNYDAAQFAALVGGSKRAEHKKFDTDVEFQNEISRRIVNYNRSEIVEYLDSHTRFRLSLTCRDEKGLLAKLAQAIYDMGGSLAGGWQFTKGRYAVLEFVAEWPGEAVFEGEEIKRRLADLFDLSDKVASSEGGTDHSAIQVAEITSENDAEFEYLHRFTVTFIDQPGIARNVFRIVSHKENKTVINTQLDTFPRGGIMLGRLQFSLDGKQLPPLLQTRIERSLRELPGILYVESTTLRGRFWGKPDHGF